MEFLQYKPIIANIDPKQNTLPYNFMHLLYSLLVQNNKTFTNILYITHEEHGIKYKCSYQDFIEFLLQQSDYYDLIDRDIIINGDDWLIHYDMIDLCIWKFTFISDQFIIVD